MFLPGLASYHLSFAFCTYRKKTSVPKTATAPYGSFLLSPNSTNERKTLCTLTLEKQRVRAKISCTAGAVRLLLSNG